MDAVTWNLSAPDQRLAYPGFPQGQPWGGNAAHNDGYLAALQNAYGTARSPGLPQDPIRTPSPHLNVASDHLAGQGAHAWEQNPLPQPSLTNVSTEPLPSTTATDQMEPPMISVRAASPSSKDADTAALMSLLDSSSCAYPHATGNTYPASMVQRANSGSPTRGSSTAVSLSSSAPGGKVDAQVPSMNLTHPQPQLGMASQFLPHDARRKDSAQLRNFLKLDVDMGFVSDGKNESPTMLQPTFGWKKRRSVSDVGPRTPSMLGFAMDHNAISPMDDMSFLMPEPRPSKDASSVPNDAALHFASLNIDVNEDTMGKQAQAPTANFSSTQSDSQSLMRSPSMQPVLSPNEPQQQPMGSPSSPTTLNPTLIQGAPLMPPFSTYTPPVFADDASASRGADTGPIRPKSASRSARSASPYHASSRSITSESDVSFDGAEPLDPGTRMARWRFPNLSEQSGDSLHPLDAYARTGINMPHARTPSHPRGRRHMRAAVSEDFNGRTREAMGGWGHSVDLSRGTMSPFTLLSPASAPGSEAGSRAVSPDVALWAATQESQLLQARSEQPSPAGSDLALSPHPPALQLSPKSSTSNSSPEAQPVQTAAQTRTPIVTTSAAQAASASRRKAEALFTCPFPDCGSTFTRQYNLRGHMRSHMDQRPFKCDWPGCGRSFARTHDCKRHHNLHLNIKPYSCESCGKTFARLDALNRHHKSEAGSCGGHSEGRDSTTPG